MQLLNFFSGSTLSSTESVITCGSTCTTAMYLYGRPLYPVAVRCTRSLHQFTSVIEKLLPHLLLPHRLLDRIELIPSRSY